MPVCGMSLNTPFCHYGHTSILSIFCEVKKIQERNYLFQKRSTFSQSVQIQPIRLQVT